MSNTAVHAAGLYRAAHGYGFMQKSRHETVEDFNYATILDKYFAMNRNCTPIELSRDIVLYLGHAELLKEISFAVVNAQLEEVLNHSLYCLLALLSSYSHEAAVVEITAVAGLLMIRLLNLLHSNDEESSNLATCILLQICTKSKSREKLFARNVHHYLNEINRDLSRSDNFNNIKYQRSMLVSISLCRQQDRRLYDPQTFPNYLMNRVHRTDKVLSFDSQKNPVRKSIYLDVLKTMKCPSDDIADKMDVADLVVQPNDHLTPAAMSKTALHLQAKDLVTFFCRPEDPNYYETLPLEECAATCTIFEGFSANLDTAFDIFHPGLVLFMGKYLFLCKYLFLGKPMSDKQIHVLLNGVSSCGLALGQLAQACTPPPVDEELVLASARPKATNHLPMSRPSSRAGNPPSRNGVPSRSAADIAMAESYIHASSSTQLTASILFFVNTLSVSHPKLQEGTRRLQKTVGINCLRFLSTYAHMLLSVGGKVHESTVDDLYNAGTACINVITIY